MPGVARAVCVIMYYVVRRRRMWFLPFRAWRFLFCFVVGWVALSTCLGLYGQSGVLEELSVPKRQQAIDISSAEGPIAALQTLSMQGQNTGPLRSWTLTRLKPRGQAAGEGR